MNNAGQGGQLFGSIIEWRFIPDSIQYYQYYDHAGSPWLKPPAVVDTASPGDTIWDRAAIIHPGRVIATVLGPSNTSADTVVIGVSRRTWPNTGVVLDTAAYNADSLNLQPPSSGQPLLGGSFHPFPSSGGWPEATFWTDSLQVDSITGGPNDGYHYVLRANYHMVRGYSLNRWIDPPGVPGYFGGLSTTAWLQANGAGADMLQARSNTIMHERGPSVIGQQSHLERQHFAGGDSIGCGNLNVAVERLVAADTAALNVRLSNARTNALNAILYASGHGFVYGFQTQGTPAVADWDPAPPPPNAEYGVLDAFDSTNTNRSPPSSTWCDVSNY